MKCAVSCGEAAAAIPDGAGSIIGGFMGVGTPQRLVDELVCQGRRGLMVFANDTARPGVGIGNKLIDARLCREVIVSHIGTNPETERQMVAGELDVERVARGTLIEGIGAAGHGLGAVLTPTGAGAIVAEGKTVVEVDGRPLLLEKPLAADCAAVNPRQADHPGNRGCTLTAHNFDPVVALATRRVIAEAEDTVPVDVMAPDAVRTPGVLVDRSITRAA